MEPLIISQLDSGRIRERIATYKASNGGSTYDVDRLAAEIERARIVAPEGMPDDVVTMNSIVTVTNITHGKPMTFQLVYPEEADARNGRISVFAPVGMALLGYRKGDVVEWTLSGSKVRIRIDAIVYQPEAAGDLER